MKLILKFSLIIFTLSFVNSCKKENSKKEPKVEAYLISADITGFANGTKIYLKDMSTQKHIDSAVVKNNKFKFEGKLSETPKSDIWLDTWVGEKPNNKHYYLPLFMDNETIQIKGDVKDFPFNLNVTCSKTQKENDFNFKVAKDAESNYKKRDSLYDFFKSLTKEQQKEHIEGIRIKLIKLDSLKTDTNLKLINSNTDLYSSVNSLANLRDEISRDTLQKIYNRFIPKVKKSKSGEIIELYLKSNITKIGDKYHEFEGVNQKGKKVKFSEIKGQSYTLLEFTSNYCKGCREVEKELVEISEKYKDSLTIVSFSLDANKEGWLESVKRGKVSWNSVFSGKDYKKTEIKYGIKSIPTFLLLNSKGIVIDILDRKESSLDKEIEKNIFKK